MLKCNDGTFYTGVTNDLERRVVEHNSSNLGAKYTKARRPVKLVYSACFDGRSAAQQEEWRIKKMKKVEKLGLIKSKF